MSKKSKQPVMRKSHLPLILLGAALTGYGVVTALVGSWFSNRAMRGLLGRPLIREAGPGCSDEAVPTQREGTREGCRTCRGAASGPLRYTGGRVGSGPHSQRSNR